jgi:uncharacterized membrane protein YraQ (UPF0718 family)
VEKAGKEPFLLELSGEMTESPETTQVPAPPPAPREPVGAVLRTVLLLAVGLFAWWWVYSHLAEFSYRYTYEVMGYEPMGTKAALKQLIDGGNCACTSATITEAQLNASQTQGRAVAFVLYQLPHTFLLLGLVVFLMGVVRSFFSAEGTRRLLAGKHPALARVLAAALGVVTPFCSCSAVPLFIGFVTAGVPLGATFTFLTAAPMVNEIAIGLLFDTFRHDPNLWLILGLYIGTGLLIALITGWLVERLGMHRHVEEWVFAIQGAADGSVEERLTFTGRIHAGLAAVKEILGRVWPYVLGGVVVGTLIHAFVSQAALVKLLDQRHWWSVPLAVVVGVPIYASAAAVIPVVKALLGKGVAIGTVLAFMMAVTGLSLPEFVILRKVLKVRLILAFAGIVALGILIVGTVFNLLLSR